MVCFGDPLYGYGIGFPFSIAVSGWANIKFGLDIPYVLYCIQLQKGLADLTDSRDVFSFRHEKQLGRYNEG